MIRLGRARIARDAPGGRLRGARSVAAAARAPGRRVVALSLVVSLLALTASLVAPDVAVPPATATGGAAEDDPAPGDVSAADPGAEEGETHRRVTPLEVTIRTLTPATVPRRGRVTVTGTVRNRSDSTWTDLNVYLLMSADPLRSAADLADATGSDPAQEVGPRITDRGLYDRVSDLGPGESTEYFLSVPRGKLPATEEGVYWLGVHVLGSNEDGRVDGADGRARTFLPLVRGDEPRATLALVMPLKARVLRTQDGTVGNPAGVERQLGEDGRLSRLLALSSATGDMPLTWVVDPALLDAVSSLAAGDPPFDTGPGNRGGTGDPDDPAPTPPSDPLGGTEDADEETDEDSARARKAADWLASFVDQADGHTVMTVPYGDLDVASALRHGHEELYQRATGLSAATLEALGLSSSPVVAPPTGRLPGVILEELDSSATLLLEQQAVAADQPLVRLREGQLVVRASPVARVGGPGPNDPHGAVAVRQRILAEAALEALAGNALEPLVVPLPEQWDPGPEWRSSAFFPAMDVAWLRTVNLPFATVLSEPGLQPDGLRYPRRFSQAELPPTNLRAARQLDESGQVLDGLLTRNDTVGDEIGAAAMLGASVHARERPERALYRTRRITDAVRVQLRAVTVESSPLVTLSSETGSFSVTVVNGLAEPVTVGLSAQTGTTELEIRSPDLVRLGPGQRAAVRLAVTATDTGVHSVNIMPTTEDGRPLGKATRIKVRSSRVGLVIWLIMGVAAAVFVATTTLRVVRRVRERKRTHGPVLKGAGA